MFHNTLLDLHFLILNNRYFELIFVIVCMQSSLSFSGAKTASGANRDSKLVGMLESDKKVPELVGGSILIGNVFDGYHQTAIKNRVKKSARKVSSKPTLRRASMLLSSFRRLGASRRVIMTSL